MQYKKHLCTALISSTLLASTACTTGPVVLGVTGTDNIEGQNLEPGADNAPLLNNRPNPPEAPRGNWFTRNCCCFRFFNRHRSPSPPPVSQIDLIPSHDEVPTRSLVLLLSVTEDNRREPSTTSRQTVSLLDSPRRTTNCWQYVSSPKDCRAHSYESKTPRSRSGAYSYENKMPRSGRSTKHSRRDEYPRGYSRLEKIEKLCIEKLPKYIEKLSMDELYNLFTEDKNIMSIVNLYTGVIKNPKNIEENFRKIIDFQKDLKFVARDHMTDFIKNRPDNDETLAKILTWIASMPGSCYAYGDSDGPHVRRMLFEALDEQEETVQNEWFEHYIPFGMLFEHLSYEKQKEWAASKLDEDNFNKTILGRTYKHLLESVGTTLAKRLSAFKRQEQISIVETLLDQGNTLALKSVDPNLNDADYTNLAKKVIKSMPQAFRFVDKKRVLRKEHPDLQGYFVEDQLSRHNSRERRERACSYPNSDYSSHSSDYERKYDFRIDNY